MRQRWLFMPLALSGCVGFFSDGTSVSLGTFNRGHLLRGRALGSAGEGFLVPPLWRARKNRYGTDELVEALARAARRVRREYPGAELGIADLSPRGGGENLLHRSHENGRDADLIYYAVDERGRPLAPPSSMPRYGADLRALPPRPTSGVTYGPFSPRVFDVPRNWALVRALLEDPSIEVQYLFCNRLLEERLIEHARSIGEDPDLVDRAEALLHQPGDSLPHDDHLHLRIYCSSRDRAFGCVDNGPKRWWKKRYKYLPPERDIAVEDLGIAATPIPFLPMTGLFF